MILPVTPEQAWHALTHPSKLKACLTDEVESDGVNAYRDYEENRFTLGLGILL